MVKRINGPANAAGIRHDVDSMSNDDLLVNIRAGIGTRSQTEIELGALCVALYKKGEWKHGINGIPTERHFRTYIADKLLLDGSDVRRLTTCMDVYVGWCMTFNDAALTAKLPEAGISKLHMVIPYMEGISLEQAHTLCDLCINTRASELRDKTMKLLGFMPKNGPAERGDTAGRAAVAHISTSKTRLIGGMFIPRQNPGEMKDELAFSVLFKAACGDRPVDEVFHEMFSIWAQTLPSDVLTRAGSEWTTVVEHLTNEKVHPDRFLFAPKVHLKAVA